MTPVVLHMSPHAQGVTDTLAHLFSEAFCREQTRVQPEHILIREQHVQPCRGCNACARLPHTCVLDTGKDTASAIFHRLENAPFVVVVAPIYFYGLPAQAKALIDRGQSLWHKGAAHAHPTIPALVILAAGRKRGERLFEGALLTLRYFLALFNITIEQHLCLRGLEAPDAITQDVCEKIRMIGEAWGQRALS